MFENNNIMIKNVDFYSMMNCYKIERSIFNKANNSFSLDPFNIEIMSASYWSSINTPKHLTPDVILN